MRTNLDLNNKSFAFLDSPRFKTTEWCKAHIRELDLPNQTSNFLSCLPSLLNATKRYRNFSTCFNDPNCRAHSTRFLKRCRYLSFGNACFHSSNDICSCKPPNAYWRRDLDEASKTKSSARSNRLILNFPS